MAKCSQCLHWDSCSMLFEMAIGRKPTANGNNAEEKCPHFKDKTINNNADRIRAMSDEELAEFLVVANPTNCLECAFSCGWRCQPDRQDYSDTEKCVEGKKRWLKQPAE